MCIPGGSCDQHGAAGNLPNLDHLEKHGGGLARLLLTHQALRRLSRLQSIGIYAQAADVRVGGNEVQAPQLLALGDGHHGLLPDITLARAGPVRGAGALRLRLTAAILTGPPDSVRSVVSSNFDG